MLRESLFGRRAAETIVGYCGDNAGFGCSSRPFNVQRRAGTHLKICIIPKFRRHGLDDVLTRLAQIPIGRGYGRVEWSVLDWNSSRSASTGLGAKPMDEWTKFRLTGESLQHLPGVTVNLRRCPLASRLPSGPPVRVRTMPINQWP
jgi:hypothetical protein